MSQRPSPNSKLLDLLGLVKVNDRGLYFQLNRFKFRNWDTNTCMDAATGHFKNDRALTTNKILDMEGFNQVNDRTYTINESGLTFYVVLLDFVQATNEPKAQAFTNSEGFNLDVALSVFNKYGYENVQVTDEGLYATDSQSLMFVGALQMFDVQPFVRGLTRDRGQLENEAAAR